MAVKQALVPALVALAGADVVAAEGLTVTVATSVLPTSSVTVSVTVTLPLVGAFTVVDGPLELLTG
jgi:hypothetical protein